MRYHPDRHVPAKKKWAEEKFKELSEAYQILSDPLKRRKYDRDGYPEEFTREDGAISAEMEEAYFYYRMGLGHYRNAQKKASWRILFGRVRSDLKKAQDDFITVLDDYPTSKYEEDAHFYYICTLMESYEYDEEFLKEIEEEFTEFLDEFTGSKWSGQVKILFARFCFFRKGDNSKVNELLTEIVSLYRETGLIQQAEVLLQYTQGLDKNA